jgi:hypothetical protein
VLKRKVQEKNHSTEDSSLIMMKEIGGLKNRGTLPLPRNKPELMEWYVY